jgi:hypothetical protein
MAPAPERTTVIGPFPFRIEPEQAKRYCIAVGMRDTALPSSMAVCALTSDPVLPVFKEIIGARIPVHLGQDTLIEHPLRAGMDYSCEVRLVTRGEKSLQIEQRLWDSDGRPCLTLTSLIGLAGS